jgi:hypothetical protein
VTKVEDLNKKNLGIANLVEQPEDAEIIRISGCKNPKAVTILLRGSTDYLLDELERAVVDGTRVVMDTMEDAKLLVGGGAVEIELLMKIHDYAASIGGRVQLAIEAYASKFKEKLLITYFDDRTTEGEEVLGDWVAEKLMKEVNRRTLQVLFVDYQMVKEFFEKNGTGLKNLETSRGLQYLNEVFGIHALVAGELSGPYVFATKTTKDQEETASAIIKIDMRLVDTLSGKIFKNLSTSNPIFATKEKGTFSEEKAKIKAIDFTIGTLGRSLAKELDGMDWFCRIAKVEGQEVYINAGRSTGLKVGDVMEVFRPDGSGERGEVKGKIKILDFFGIDASMGRLIQGKNPDVNDILKLARLYAMTKPASIQEGNSLEFMANSFDTFRVTSILRSITGNLNVPGGDVFLTPAKHARPGRLMLLGKVGRDIRFACSTSKAVNRNDFAHIPSSAKGFSSWDRYSLAAFKSFAFFCRYLK